MSTIYTTREGDTVDFIAWRYYGTGSMTVAMLQANPGLADYGPVLPGGIDLVLPDAEAQDTTEGVRLWD